MSVCMHVSMYVSMHVRMYESRHGMVWYGRVKFVGMLKCIHAYIYM